jgi:hypothetical protein
MRSDGALCRDRPVCARPGCHPLAGPPRTILPCGATIAVASCKRTFGHRRLFPQQLNRTLLGFILSSIIFLDDNNVGKKTEERERGVRSTCGDTLYMLPAYLLIFFPKLAFLSFFQRIFVTVFCVCLQSGARPRQLSSSSVMVMRWSGIFLRWSSLRSR